MAARAASAGTSNAARTSAASSGRLRAIKLSPAPAPLALQVDCADRVLVGQLCEHLVDHLDHVSLLVPEVVEQALERGVGDLQLCRGELEVIVKPLVGRAGLPLVCLGHPGALSLARV